MGNKSDTTYTANTDTDTGNGTGENTTDADASQRASRASVTINTEDDEGETGKRTVNIDELGHDYDASNDLGDSWRLIATNGSEREPYPPPTWGYADMGAGRDAALGRTSSHCEACGREVDGWDGKTYLPLKMYPNDYRHENVVILCRDCYDFTPNWREVVMDRRPDRSPVERTMDWLRNPRARLLFWRRVGVGLGAAILVGAVLSIIATLGAMILGSGSRGVGISIGVSIVTTLVTALAPAWGWIHSVLSP